LKFLEIDKSEPMKFVEPGHFTDPDAAARKLVEHQQRRGGAGGPDDLRQCIAVRSIKHIAPPVIDLGNHSARSNNKSNPKRHFKDHESGPVIFAVVGNDQNLVRG
jgi:hypothetical protein